MTIRHKDVKKVDAKLLARGEGGAEDIEVVRSEGSILLGPNGRKYIDFAMGWNVGNLGWGTEHLKQIITQYDGPSYVHPDYLYRPWTELAALLTSIAPGKLNRCFRATGGSEAVDLALRAAMAFTGRRKFVSVKDSYHGQTLAALSVGASESIEKLPGGRLFPCSQIETPLGNKAAQQLEKLLKRRDVAAFIMEPIILNLGVEIPEKEFMMRAQELCRKYGTLLIMDEVATGFGRTGKLFASEHFEIEPDIMCLAKAMTNGLLGIGATLCRADVAESVNYTYSTYGWHPLSVEVALQTVHFMLRHKDALLGHVDEMSHSIQSRVSEMDFGGLVRVRAKGLAIGIEFEKRKLASKITEAARERGLLLSEISEESLSMFPALNVERETVARAMDILEECSETSLRRAA